MEVLAPSHHNVSYHVVSWSPTADNHSLLDDDDDDVGVGGDQFDLVLFSVVVPLLFGIISVLGLIGNLLVVHVIRSRRKMRTVTNLLLLNLALADLSFVLICPPFTAYQLATSTWLFGGSRLGDIICKLMHYLLNVTVYVTIYTLVIISLIRYLTIVHNAATVWLRTQRNTLFILAALWMIVLAVNAPILTSYGVQPDVGGVVICDNFSLEIGQKIFATFFAFAYVLPLAIIGVFTVCILRHIRRQQSSLLNSKKSKSNAKKRQATRLIVLVIVIFALFWLPIHVHLLLAYYSSVPETPLYKCASVLWNCLAYFNSCVNPIIYNYTSKEFRDAFRDTVCCVKRNADWDREGTVVSKITQGQRHLASATGDVEEAKGKNVVVITANNNVQTDNEEAQQV